MAVRVAIDIGGTFTDATLIDEETGRVSIAKVLHDAVRSVEGFMDAVDRALAEGGVAAAAGRLRRARDDRRDERDHRGQDRPQRLRHDRRLPRPARDRAPGPPDALRHPVREAAAARPARPRRRRRRAARARGRGRCSRSTRTRCATPRRCCAAKASSRSPSASSTPTSTRSTSAGSARSSPRSFPGVPVSLSAEVAPEFREYLRASTTVINAAIRPVVERYLERIEARLVEAGIDAKLLVMQSSGGVFSSEAASAPPGLHGRVGPGGRRDRRGVRSARRSASRTSSPSTWAARPRRSA